MSRDRADPRCRRSRSTLGVTRTASPKLAVYATLAAASLLGSLVLGRPELAALAAPLVLVLAVGLGLADEPRLTVGATLERARVAEGDEVALDLELGSDRALEQLEIFVSLPRGLIRRRGTAADTIRLQKDERRTIRRALRAQRWGGYRLEEVLLRTRSPLGLVVHEGRATLDAELRVYPREETLRELVGSRETQVFTGNIVARAKEAEGIEFADIRSFVPGDQIRRINWRASARWPGLWVNQLHPERNADVILFVDSFEEARREDEGTLDMAVRAAATIARRYLAQRDRVGLVGFGATLRWLLPRMGSIQLYRIIEALIDIEISLSYAWSGIDVIPRRVLPPRALVVALSPLLDERSQRALLDLPARGFDLVVVEVSPIPFGPTPAGPVEELARRLWELKREALRSRYERHGVPVADWRAGTELAGAIEGVNAFRRYARRARAY